MWRYGLARLRQASGWGCWRSPGRGAGPIAVGNGPGEPVEDIVDALKLVRAGKNVNFQGAGSTCDFTPNGDQLGRGMGQWIIKGGKNVFVEYAKP